MQRNVIDGHLEGFLIRKQGKEKMGWKNEFDKTGRSIKDGERAQQNFVRIFTNRFGVAPIKSSDEEDKCDHIDYFMEIPARDGTHRASVDVKSWKHDQNNVWIEFVSYGKLGWLYGKADYIGFELPTQDGFIMVKREALVGLVARSCIAYFTRDKDKALFNMYVRWKGENFDRYDCATLIPRKRLYEIEHWILK